MCNVQGPLGMWEREDGGHTAGSRSLRMHCCDSYHWLKAPREIYDETRTHNIKGTGGRVIGLTVPKIKNMNIGMGLMVCQSSRWEILTKKWLNCTVQFTVPECRLRMMDDTCGAVGTTDHGWNLACLTSHPSSNIAKVIVVIITIVIIRGHYSHHHCHQKRTNCDVQQLTKAA